MVEELDAAGLIARLEALGPPGLLTFDADGTLWSGDAGEDTFVAALEAGYLDNRIEPALQAAAMRAGLPATSGVVELCFSIFEAYRDGRFDEREVCEVMTWCYAGRTPGELAQFVSGVFATSTPSRGLLRERYQRQVMEVIDWARGRGCRCVIISASPRIVLEVAAAPLGFAPEDIVGARAAIDEHGVIEARMDGQVPYAADKARAGRELAGASPWLAAFGDSAFDVEMMKVARLGVGVQPKAALRDALAQLPAACILG